MVMFVTFRVEKIPFNCDVYFALKIRFFLATFKGGGVGEATMPDRSTSMADHSSILRKRSSSSASVAALALPVNIKKAIKANRKLESVNGIKIGRGGGRSWGYTVDHA